MTDNIRGDYGLAASVPTGGPLDDLIARLEAASEGSGALDDLVGRAIGCILTGITDGVWGVKPGGWTQSLDAALALAERVLPEHGPIDLTIMGSAKVTIWSNDPCGRDLSDAFGHTPALALCIAVLKAVSVGTERSEVSSNTPTTHKGEDQ